MSGAEDLYSRPATGNEFTFRWKIKHFSMFCIKENNNLTSHLFTVPSLGNSGWHVKLEFKDSKTAMCYLVRKGNGPENIKIFYSISVDSSYAVQFQTFRKDSISSMFGIVNLEEFNRKVDLGLAKDVLHIECFLWSFSNDVQQPQNMPVSPYPVFFSACTVISFEERNFFYSVKNFGDRTHNTPENICVNSAAIIHFKLTCKFWNENHVLRMMIQQPEDKARTEPFVLKCRVQVVDALKKYHELYRGRFAFNVIGDGSDKMWNFTLTKSKVELFKEKDLYFPNDELLLYYEFGISCNTSERHFESTRYDTSNIPAMNRNSSWGLYLEHKYNEHKTFFRFFAILVVILSILPHMFSSSTL